jgi:serine/threonine-protein kinase
MRVCPKCGLRYRDETERCFLDGSELEEVADDRLGTVIRGRYELESVIGQGGMATVYRATHRVVDRPVAVKVLHDKYSRDEAMRERFRREAKNTAALAHPNIVEIEDYGDTEDGTSYLVMEYLVGAPLNDVVVDQAPMPGDRVAAVGMQIARGLARAHDFGVFHRDLKPENIFIAEDLEGRQLVKLLDFGIARSLHDPRLTSQGEIFGTPQYMAPERVKSIDAGAAADLYALGCILFEMLVGRLPFVSPDMTGFLVQHLQSQPPRPSDLATGVPRRLEDLILSLLEKLPEDRPVDAHQVVKALGALVPKNDRDSLPPSRTTTGAHQVAPTLPPTTLERWKRRAALFEKMLATAFPNDSAPAPMVKGVGEIRGYVSRIAELRDSSLEAQRRLELREAAIREKRERLGHAVHTLAQDLSQAREAARAASKEVEPYLVDEREAETNYRLAHAAFDRAGGYDGPLESPDAALAERLRALAETLDRWQLARETGDRARRWAEAREREVADLDFQLAALRQQLDRAEAEADTGRGEEQDQLETQGREIEKLESAALRLATFLAEALRPRPELRSLFRELEA